MNTPESIPEDSREADQEEYEAYDRETFATCFQVVSNQIHETARSKGWWDGREAIERAAAFAGPGLEEIARAANDSSLIALIQSEASEALEALRAGNPPDDKIPEFSGAEAELADVVIRAMDMNAARGWNVGAAIKAKMEMNKTRSHMHGGKKF